MENVKSVRNVGYVMLMIAVALGFSTYLSNDELCQFTLGFWGAVFAIEGFEKATVCDDFDGNI